MYGGKIIKTYYINRSTKRKEAAKRNGFTEGIMIWKDWERRELMRINGRTLERHDRIGKRPLCLVSKKSKINSLKTSKKLKQIYLIF